MMNQPNNTNSLHDHLSSAGWYPREDLEPYQVMHMKRMNKFIQEGVSVVSTMLSNLATFQQLQMNIAHYQTSHQNAAVNDAIQRMIDYVLSHWRRVTVVYQEYLNIGYHPPRNADDSS